MDMFSDGFSVRTIEESISTKQGFLNDKSNEDKIPNKYYKMDYNPNTKNSKQIKAAFKLYNKNLSYCSNEEEKSGNEKKRNSISGNNSSLNTSSKVNENPTQHERTKMRSISSASSIKSIQISQMKMNNYVKEIKEICIEENEGTKSTKKPIRKDELTSEKKSSRMVIIPKQMDETLSSIYTSIEENSVCNKRHDISVVEADGLIDQINNRMMKFHFEMIYKNLDKQYGNINDFSFEIDNTNNMIVPKNSNNPIKNKRFIQLPCREDLYKEKELSNGNLQWIEDTQTIRLYPQSPVRDAGSVSSPFTSPQTNARTPYRNVTSPGSSTRASKSTIRHHAKRSMYENQYNSQNMYSKSIYLSKEYNNLNHSSIIEINDHEDAEKDKNDDIEIERELEYSQVFISILNPNTSTQFEKSFESRVSEGTESINTNNYSFNSWISGGGLSVSKFTQLRKEASFIKYVREKIHVHALKKFDFSIYTSYTHGVFGNPITLFGFRHCKIDFE